MTSYEISFPAAEHKSAQDIMSKIVRMLALAVTVATIVSILLESNQDDVKITESSLTSGKYTQDDCLSVELSGSPIIAMCSIACAAFVQ